MSAPIANQIQSLEETFRTFDQLTESLESNYTNLEDRVAQLQQQLTTVRRKHRDEITARDSIAKKLSSVLSALPAGEGLSSARLCHVLMMGTRFH